jgi:hypothetical protein
VAPPEPRARRRDDAPLPPWGRFPLIELCALAAIVLGIWGILRGGSGGGILLVSAALLGSVAGLEVAIREHFGGYRSHTLLLSGVLGVAVLTAIGFAGASRPWAVAAAAVVLAIAVGGLRYAFRRRSGGAGFRVR